jgi:pectate lyase-like protein/tail fiber protein
MRRHVEVMVTALVAVLAVPAGTLAQQTSVEYVGDGKTRTFAVPFPFLERSHLAVSLVSVTPPFAEKILSPSSDYSVTGEGTAKGGAVVLTGAAPTSAQKIRIRRRTPRQLLSSDQLETVDLAQLKLSLQRQAMALQELADDATAVHVTAAGTPTPRTLAARYAETINVMDFGCAGDGLKDDTACIGGALSRAEAYSGPSTVYFPAGRYRVTSTLRISRSYVRLQGSNIIAANAPPDVIGSFIIGDHNGMGDVFLVQAPGGAAIYGVQFEYLRIGATPGLSSPPNGIQFKDASEVVVSSCFLGKGLADALRLNGTVIATIRSLTASTNAVGIHLALSGTSAFHENSSIAFQSLNLWTHSIAGIQIDSQTNGNSVRDSWIENTPTGILITESGAPGFALDGLLLDNLNVFNGVSSPFKDSRFLRVAARNSSTSYLSIRNIHVRSCRSFAIDAKYNIELALAANRNPATTCEGFLIDGGQWYGASAAVLRADSPSTSGAVEGVLVARAGYQTGASIPYTDARGSWSRLAASPKSQLWDATGLSVAEGIRFPPPKSAETTSTTLSAFAEGTWTPKDASGAAINLANVASNCRYVKIGRLVFASFRVTFPQNSSGASAAIGGLPFASSAIASSVYGGRPSYTDAGVDLSFLVAAGDRKFNFYDVTGKQLTNGSLSRRDVRGTAIYEASE